jgi:glycerate 2-kinase
MTRYRKCAGEIFRAGVAAVLPDKLVRAQVSLQNANLAIGNATFDLRSFRDIYVVGAGKACGLMAGEVEAILGDRITDGHGITKYGHGCGLRRIKMTQAGHPTPDANGLKGTQEILRIARRAAKDDLVLCLLSGGASALMADCPDGAALDDLIHVNELLVRCGANIAQINAVRKHLSRIKGGQLAKAAQPASIAALILSDVGGDPLDVIASGPTAPDRSTFRDALETVEKFGIAPQMPPAFHQHLIAGFQGRIPETPKEGDPIFERVHNVIIGNNRMALDAGLKKAEAMGFEARIADLALNGDAIFMARAIVHEAVAMQRRLVNQKACLLLGGETTVKVAGPGLGGRNQHLALAAAIELANKPGITVLCAGTDGSDGPTQAAGAVVDFRTVPDARAKGIDAERHLREFDSFHFFEKAGGQIITGPTMTNVMDMAVVMVEPM